MASTINSQVADRLLEAAEFLEQQGANPFRINAYRRAAQTVASLDLDIGDLLEDQGLDGLIALPGIGSGIAAAIYELVATGRWGQLERLRGTVDPIKLFQSIPGVGPSLAERIHDALHVDTLPALEAAALDGRLEQVHGVGNRRAAAIRNTLDTKLRRVQQQRQRPPKDRPRIELLLEVDEQYRRESDSGQLPRIAPKRFNPEGNAWLPILHTMRGEWHFTALFSNTARAHELGRTRDWVVIYFYDDQHEEGQHTVVTETRGPLIGRRVVRGRELECRRHYVATNGEEGRASH